MGRRRRSRLRCAVRFAEHAPDCGEQEQQHSCRRRDEPGESAAPPLGRRSGHSRFLVRWGSPGVDGRRLEAWGGARRQGRVISRAIAGERSPRPGRRPSGSRTRGRLDDHRRVDRRSRDAGQGRERPRLHGAAQRNSGECPSGVARRRARRGRLDRRARRCWHPPRSCRKGISRDEICRKGSRRDESGGTLGGSCRGSARRISGERTCLASSRERESPGGRDPVEGEQLVDIQDEDERAIHVGEPDAGVRAGEAGLRVVPGEELLDVELPTGRLDEESDRSGLLADASRQDEDWGPPGDRSPPPREPEPRVDDGGRVTSQPDQAEQRRRHARDSRDRRRRDDLPDPAEVDGELALAHMEGQELHRPDRAEHADGEVSRRGMWGVCGMERPSRFSRTGRAFAQRTASREAIHPGVPKRLSRSKIIVDPAEQAKSGNGRLPPTRDRHDVVVLDAVR